MEQYPNEPGQTHLVLCKYKVLLYASRANIGLYMRKQDMDVIDANEMYSRAGKSAYRMSERVDDIWVCDKRLRGSAGAK